MRQATTRPHLVRPGGLLARREQLISHGVSLSDPLPAAALSHSLGHLSYALFRRHLHSTVFIARMSAESEAVQHRVVFLDCRPLKLGKMRPLSFPHDTEYHESTLPSQTAGRLHDATIAITGRVAIGQTELDAAPRLRLIAVHATGVDNIDLEGCSRRGIVVTNVPEWCASSVSEHAFSLMLALRRQLLDYHRAVQAGAWQRSMGWEHLITPLPRSLSGSTLGIVGAGRLGSRIAAIAKAFDMRVIVAERRGTQPPRPGRTDLSELLSTADVVCCQCPLTAETRGLIGEEELRSMKPTALLIDCSRGGVVSNAALARALTESWIAGAGVDVLEQEPPRAGNPLLRLSLPNLLVTPHVAWAGQAAIQSLIDQLLDGVDSFVLTGKAINEVTTSAATAAAAAAQTP